MVDAGAVHDNYDNGNLGGKGELEEWRACAWCVTSKKDWGERLATPFKLQEARYPNMTAGMLVQNLLDRFC